MVRQRPDGTGRHTAGLITKSAVAGAGTPYSKTTSPAAMPRSAASSSAGLRPRTWALPSVAASSGSIRPNTTSPLTADDMIRGTVFCDFGTVEKTSPCTPNQFRVAPGFGFRINVPAMGPAPLAFDFAFPSPPPPPTTVKCSASSSAPSR